MKILVIGAGAREHAIVRALLADPSVSEVIAAPGNAGIASDVRTVPVDQADPEAIGDLARSLGADLVVIGTGARLVAGAADAVSARAAHVEGSKAFAKDVMAAAGVPTAASLTCRTEAEVAAALDRFGAPHVV